MGIYLDTGGPSDRDFASVWIELLAHTSMCNFHLQTTTLVPYVVELAYIYVFPENPAKSINIPGHRHHRLFVFRVRRNVSSPSMRSSSLYFKP